MINVMQLQMLPSGQDSSETSTSSSEMEESKVEVAEDVSQAQPEAWCVFVLLVVFSSNLLDLRMHAVWQWQVYMM